MVLYLPIDLFSPTSNGEYTCPVCGEPHAVPKERDLPTSSTLLGLLRQRPREFPRSPLIREFVAGLERLRRRAFAAEGELANNGRDKVVAFCQEMRIDVQLATERKIEEVHGASDLLLARVSRYEAECLRHLERVVIARPEQSLNKVGYFGLLLFY